MLIGLTHGYDALRAALGADTPWATQSFLKLVWTIGLPLLLIGLSPKLRAASGIAFTRAGDACKLALRSYSVVGPACAGFALIGLLGWTFRDWAGSLTLSAIFSVALALQPRVASDLPTEPSVAPGRPSMLVGLLLGAVVTALISVFAPEALPDVLWRALYFVFLVALGEELFFRGFVQPSLNLVFGRPFAFGGVPFGWGLPLTAVLFGLIHALLPTPNAWPWMGFTTVGGLILGYIREKDGSLFAPVLLHAAMDAPLWFM